ncbi:MAG TPA: TetR family transcriptional regulator [Thermobifida alba]|nr:TetR family transcriptional regulator [Thermobifida alba]
MTTDADRLPGTAAAVPVPGRRGRRNDPGRRDRIIDACLDVIVEQGVAGASHRKIAAAAGVPLGSMTYHFTGMDELLREAFRRFALGVSARFERRMLDARDAEEAKAAVVALITADLLSSRRDLVLTSELYTLAVRKPEFRDLTNRWMARSRAALERHFDPVTARLLDALIEGLTLHRGLDTEPHDTAAVVEAVDRITRCGN